MNSVFTLALCCLALRPDVPRNPADDIKPAVAKGLAYLAKQQNADGSWVAVNGQYPTALTALAGTALLMEGSSTLKDGKYAPQLRKAVDWFEKHAHANGLLLADMQSEQGRYMLGHGFGMMFLALAYGEEEDADRRQRLEKLLQKAVAFAGTAQTNRGGWGYVSAADGNNFDEGHATVVVLHGLRAARNAGIPVPKAVLDSANKYLDVATLASGGIVYSLAAGAGGAGRPIITSAAAALASPGATPPKYAAWIKFVASVQNPNQFNREAYGLLQHFYFAHVVYALGTDGHRKLDPAAKDADLIRWPAYRAVLYKGLKEMQAADGSWNDTAIGPVYATSLALVILQLENEAVPFFAVRDAQR